MPRIFLPRILAVSLAAGLVATFAVASASPATAGPPPVTQGPPPADPLNTFKLENLATGLCIAPAGGSAALNDVMVSFSCDADPSRLFTNASRTDDYTEFFDTADNECLSPAGGSTAAGATIVQYTCDADPSRGWATAFIPSVDSSQFHLVNGHSGLCVAPSGAGSNTALVQEPCTDGDMSQRWYRSWTDQLRNVHSQLCMYSKNPGVNASVNQTYCGAPYKLTVDTSGSYVMEDAQDGLCLSPAGGSTVKNTPIVEYLCDGDPARHWTITWSNGVYAFQNVKSGMCLSPAGGSTAPVTPIVQYYCDGDPSRLWTVEPQ